MAKLTDEQFSAYLAEAKKKLSAELPIAAEKKINYGYQYSVKLAEAKLTLNIYNGKKGLNVVYSGDSALAERAAALLEGRRAQAAAPATFVTDGLWAGSDESGKGDFFGSLVVAAVVVDNSTADKLRAAGVKDCKLLTDKKILELEDIIKASVVDYSVLELKPRVYNLRYEQVAAQGGKLNQLLGYGHVAALSKVLEKHEDCHSALIDQFTTSMVNIRALKQRFPQCDVRQQPKAESNLAVAAASVLARVQFLHTMAALAVEAGVQELPKGGGAQATACARELAAKYGKEALRNYVKLHFANYQRV
ncbi:ribonuclease HIII [uncultured Phascolarctobacterium sp.]|jgi:ribonuclease HIII|uniref:ribonuclease HIII n=1 Tax=uncultured Phascolarctobacterium sp. TaxID=512296 RepID=UPI0025F88669|nr:ribonuclease HIII [uncultured Phascolarctobacterium sp.]